LISIRKSVNDLERIAELQKATASCYDLALRASAEYVVELEPSDAAEFRKHLFALQDSLEKASCPEDFKAVQSSFRGELRDYRDKSLDAIEKTRSDLKAAAEAMRVLANTVAANGTDHAKVLTADLQNLAAIADTSDLGRIRSVIKTSAQNISQSFEHMQRETQLVVAQLHDEIRSLHREMSNERKALYTDAASGGWNRDKLNLRLEDLLSSGEGFTAVILWISNLKRLESSCSQPVIDGALKGMVKRLNGIVGSDSMVGRWSREEFVVFLELDSSAAVSLCAEMTQVLSTRYAVQENGVSQHLTLRVATAVADRPPASNPERFREKLQLLAGAMQGL
jgi:GGDEF domain-containing protein